VDLPPSFLLCPAAENGKATLTFTLGDEEDGRGMQHG